MKIDLQTSSVRARKELDVRRVNTILNCINRARRGSVEHAFALVEEFERIPLWITPNVLEELYPYLMVDHVGLEKLDKMDRVKLSYGILKATAYICRGDEREANMHREIKYVAPLVEYRGEIMRSATRAFDDWCDFVYGKGVSDIAIAARDADMFTVVTGVLTVYLTNWQIGPHTLHNDDIARLSIRLWLVDNEHATRDKDNFHGRANLLQATFQTRSDIERSQYVEMVIQEAGGDTDRVAELALRRLRQSTQDCRDSLALSGHVTAMCPLLHETHDGNEPSIRRALLSQKFVSASTFAMKKLANDKFTKRTQEAREISQDRFDQTTIFTLHFYFFNVIRAFEDVNATQYLLEAIDAGFIRVLLSSAPSLHKHRNVNKDVDFDFVNKFLEIRLPQFLIYHSVWRALTNVMSTIHPKDLQPIEASDYGRAFKCFTRCLLDMSVFHYELSRTIEKQGRPLYCSTCFKLTPLTLLKICAGCQTELYCSKKCQTVQWREKGHRDECRSLEGSLRYRDQFYLTQLALYDLRRHTALLPRIALKSDRKMDSKNTILWPTIDYATTPITIDFEDQEPDDESRRDPSDDCIVVFYPVGAATGEDSTVDSLEIPRKYIEEHYTVRRRVGEPPRMLNSSNDVQPRSQGTGTFMEELNAFAVPDEVDVLVDVILRGHATNPDPEKHPWQRIEELTEEIRKPENWPFENWGPFASPNDDADVSDGRTCIIS